MGFNLYQIKQAAAQDQRLSSSEVERLVKHELLQSQAIRKLFQEYKIDPAQINTLRVVLDGSHLNDEYAKTDGEKMYLHPNYFSTPRQIEENAFILAHEIVHWMTRIKEQQGYFNDPEELLGFTMSIAWALEKGYDLNTVWNKIFPKVKFHFNDEAKAKQVFENMIMKARTFV